MGKDAESIRRVWDEKRSKNLDLSRPKIDADADEDARVEHIKRRMWHLAETMAFLHKIYFSSKELYGEAFLAFVGDKVVRHWPWKDYPLVSEGARGAIEDFGNVTGCRLGDITGKELGEYNKVLNEAAKTKDGSKKSKEKPSITYEHVTPMTFFRDCLRNDPPIHARTYYRLLKKYYRVAWISRAEDKELGENKFRSWRPEGTYENLGIELPDHPVWKKLDEEASSIAEERSE